MEKKTIGSFIAALRKANGLTQKQLADMLNVSDKAVSRWERDECAPDLSLIPVLAEIFNVTADEILRGQRNNPDLEPRPADAVKSQRQRAYLLRSVQSKFRVRSILCCSLAIVGVILACILNFEFNAPNAGFLTSLVLSLSAAVLQITGLITGSAALGSEDDESLTLAKCKSSMLYWTQTVLTTAVITLALIIPMAGSQETVPFLRCLTAGCKWALGAAVLGFLACLCVNIVVHLRSKQTGEGRAILCRSITALLLIGVLIGHISLNQFLLSNRHLYTPCETFTDLDAFRRQMEERRTPEGYPALVDTQYYDNKSDPNQYLYIYENPLTGDKTVYTHDELFRTLAEPTAPYRTFFDRFVPEYGYEFFHFNRQMAHYEITGGEDIAPIYTFTQEQLRQSEQTAVTYSLLYTFAYGIPIAIGFTLYFLLRRKHR